MTPLRGPAAALTGYMEQSLTIPTATSFRGIAVDVLDARRKELNGAVKAAGRNERISFTHLIAYALVLAAREMPFITYSFRRDEDGKPARLEPGIHLGLAVDSERKDGSRFLVVPVIRDAGSLDFAAFRAKYEDLVAASRENRLTADDLQGASFTLTNPGGIGTAASVPRLMAGQGAIIATGAIGYPAGLRRSQRTVAAAARRLARDANHQHLRPSRDPRRAIRRIPASRRRALTRRRRFLRNGFLVARTAGRTGSASRAGDGRHRRNQAVRRNAAGRRRRHGDRLGVPASRTLGRQSRSARRRAGRRFVARAADLRFDAGAAERDTGVGFTRQSSRHHAGRGFAAAARDVQLDHRLRDRAYLQRQRARLAARLHRIGQK